MSSMVFCRGCGKEIHETAPTCPHCGAVQNAIYMANTGAAGTNASSGHPGFWLRLVAALIDLLALGLAAFMVGLVLGIGLAVSGGSSEESELFGNFIGFFLGWLYSALFESSRLQATPGKLALGIYVTDLDGQRISFLRATGRHFGKFISAIILCIGYLMCAFTERKQCLHDIMAGCLMQRKA